MLLFFAMNRLQKKVVYFNSFILLLGILFVFICFLYLLFWCSLVISLSKAANFCSSGREIITTTISGVILIELGICKSWGNLPLPHILGVTLLMIITSSLFHYQLQRTGGTCTLWDTLFHSYAFHFLQLVLTFATRALFRNRGYLPHPA